MPQPEKLDPNAVAWFPPEHHNGFGHFREVLEPINDGGIERSQFGDLAIWVADIDNGYFKRFTGPKEEYISVQ
jgi:hypothetical protein